MCGYWKVGRRYAKKGHHRRLPLNCRVSPPSITLNSTSSCRAVLLLPPGKPMLRTHDLRLFVTGMLTNLTKLPLDRIHNNLKMFMSGGDNKYDKSLPELQQLLRREA